MEQDFKARPYGESAKPEKNPFDGFEGYGLSTSSHPTGVSPYPPSKEVDTHNVYDDMPEVCSESPIQIALVSCPSIGALARAQRGVHDHPQ